MSKPDAPTPPNPVDTARASTSTNVATSIANAFLNNTSQNTPDGALRYDVTGDYTWNDPYTGLNVNIPTFTATQTLSPQQQGIQDQSNAAKFNLAGMANAQSQRLSSLLANDINLSGAPAAGQPGGILGIPAAATSFGDAGDIQSQLGDAGDITKTYGPADDFSSDRGRVEEALYGRLNPQLARERGNIEQRLADQGIRYGSQAYTSAMDDYNRQANDLRLGVTQTAGAEQQRMMDMAAQKAGFQNAAQQQQYQQLLSSGTFSNQAQRDLFQQQAARGEFQNAGLAQQLAQQQTAFNAQNMARNQYMSEQYAMRNQPINEISALISGSQINNPNFVNTPNNQIPTTDVAGLINSRFSQDMDIYKQESANNNALMGGIFGMAGGLLKGGMMMSDVREKKDIVKVGSIFTPNYVRDVDADEPGQGYKPMEADDDELPIYQYAYRDDPSGTRRIGPMAQDVEKIDPEAVRTIAGRKHIDVHRAMGSILGMA